MVGSRSAAASSGGDAGDRRSTRPPATSTSEDSSRVRVFVPRVVPDVTTGRRDRRRPHRRDPDRPGGARPGRRRRRLELPLRDRHRHLLRDQRPLRSRRLRTRRSTPVTADVSGLTMETTYHYRLVAANSVDSNAGRRQDLHAARGARPEHRSGDGVTPASATLNGSFDPTTKTPTTTSNGAPTPPTATRPRTTRRVDRVLRPGPRRRARRSAASSSFTKYHYRIVAVNGRRNQLRRRPRRHDRAARTADDQRNGRIRRHRRQRHDLRRRQPGLRRHLLRRSNTAPAPPTTPKSPEAHPARTRRQRPPDRGRRSPASSPGPPITSGSSRPTSAGRRHGPDMIFTTLDLPTIGLDGRLGGHADDARS